MRVWNGTHSMGLAFFQLARKVDKLIGKFFLKKFADDGFDGGAMTFIKLADETLHGISFGIRLLVRSDFK